MSALPRVGVLQEYTGSTSEKLRAIWLSFHELPVPEKGDFPWDACHIEEQALSVTEKLRWQSIHLFTCSCNFQAQLFIPKASQDEPLLLFSGSSSAVGYLFQNYIKRAEQHKAQQVA